MSRLPIVAIALCGVSPLLAATDAEIRQCRAQVADAARLACYDALFGRAGGPAPAPATPATSAAPAVPAAAVATTAVPAAAPTAPAAGGTAAFGLPAATPDEITSTIPGRFEGWEANTRITLANGQVWQISDGSRGVYRLVDPKVRIRKGMLGSFFLDIEGQNQTPRVRRVQ
jgi:hypothetical protein